ncbi:UNVERIFIED_CONTAM: hypothetical protein RKD50_000184 [Streptomyces canus]
MPSVRFVPWRTTWFSVPVGPLAGLTDVRAACFGGVEHPCWQTPCIEYSTGVSASAGVTTSAYWPASAEEVVRQLKLKVPTLSPLHWYA